MNVLQMIFPLLASAFLLPRVLSAQLTDSMAFHRGQWGAEFQIGSGFFGAGTLHFTSPTHAWLMNASAAYAHTSGSGFGVSTVNTGSIALDLGTRAYRSFGRRLYRLTTFGVSLSYSRQTTNLGTTTQLLGGGPFADLGATWLVTPHLGIGARWRAAIAYTHGKASGGGSSSTVDYVRVSVDGVVLTGQLYF